MPNTDFSGFPPETMKFLKQLKRNNDRDWFQEHKGRYEKFYLEPALAFISAMQPPLKKVSPFLEAIPSKTRGSLLRIYKDTRFSKEKTPYKTHIGIQFRHEAGCNIHAPGCYIHLEPKNVFLAAGLWHPEKDPLLWIREKIAAEPQEWQKILKQKKFSEHYQMTGDSLTRPPKGFDKEHPLIEEIKRKDFIAICHLDEDMIEQSTFPKWVADRLKIATPFMQFLCEALELSY